MIDALCGRFADAESNVARSAAIATETLVRVNDPQLHVARGLIRAFRGDDNGAVDEFARVAPGPTVEGWWFTIFLPTQSDHVEALVRLGRIDEALAAVARFEQAAAHATARLADVALARCRAVLTSDTELEAAFAEALTVEDIWDSPLERARTHLCYGERLLVLGRRPEASVQLRLAVTGFEQVGALPFADRARRALRLVGPVAASPDRDRASALSAREFEIASAVARGRSNREIAAELFLSPKTVEAHLSTIYRKLDIRSRSQLVALVYEDRSAARPV